MFIFNLTIHNLWGRVLEKFQEARAVVYTDDGCIKGQLIVALQVLTELKRVRKEDAGLELNVSKPSIIPKGITQQAMFDGTDTFVRNFVPKTCRAIIDDIEKLDVIPCRL